MGSRYRFREEEIAAIQEARRKNKDKRAEQRLKALELRAKGESAKAVSQATGFCAAYVSQLVKKYLDNGLEAISGNHYGGNHRNMGREEEAAITEPHGTNPRLWKCRKILSSSIFRPTLRK